MIGLDFDGVIADIIFLKQKYAKKLYNVHLEPYECNRKSALERGIDREMYAGLAIHIYQTEAGLEAPEVKDSIEYIRRLQKEGYNVRIISSRKDNSIKYVRQWLEDKNLEIELINTNNESKADYVDGIIFFLDDDLNKLVEISSKVKFPCLLDTEYNKKDKTGKIKRVSWKEFNELIHNS